MRNPVVADSSLALPYLALKEMLHLLQRCTENLLRFQAMFWAQEVEANLHSMAMPNYC